MKEITAIQAQEWLDQGNAILIDVREEDEFQNAHIEGAQLAPLSILPQAIEEIELSQDQKIIFQCLKGGRSAQAIEFLQQNKLKDYELYNMAGGILSWVGSGLPVIEG